MAATRTTPPTDQDRVVTPARLASLAGSAFLVLLALLHVIKPELDPSWRMVSEYEIGRHGWVMTVAFLCLALGTAAVLPAIRNDVTGRAGRLGLVFLAISAVGMTMGGIFVSDPITAAKDELTTHGNLHGVGTMLGIPGFVIASVLIGRSLRRNPRWADARRAISWSTRLVWLSVLGFVGSMAALYDGEFDADVVIGWQNRLAVVAFAVWVITIGRCAERRSAPAGEADAT
jgi:hypothetical protein